MEINASMVKQLREKTGAGMMDCKKALVETQGEVEKAIDYLRKKGLSVAAKRAGRVASQGAIGSYIHHGSKIGVLVEVNCETDFVAKTDDFQALVKDIAMHVAAVNPLYLDRESVSVEDLDREKSVLREQALATGKPEKIVDKIVEGRLGKFYEENCLLEQPFVKDADQNVEALLTDLMGKCGEKISIRRFARFCIGEAE